MQVICHKTYNTYAGTKAILKDWKWGIFINFGKIPCSLIRIRILNTKTDLDPGEPNQQNDLANVKFKS